MKTQKARLLTGAVLPAFNNPLKLAGEIGMLDAISGHPRPSARDPFVWHRRCGVEAPDKKSVGLSPIPCLRWTYVPAIKSYQSGDLGVGIIGSGRIGTLRANMASRHPSVRFLAVSDLDPERAGLLGQCVNADFTSSDNLRVISHPEVNTVIVSTPEHEHTLPILQALDLGKPVFVEKPLALTLDEADQIVAAVEKSGVELRIGYSRRHDRRWMLAKEQIVQRRLGDILGIQSRVYNTRAHMMEILKRSPEATPVLDALTYYVDMAVSSRWWQQRGFCPIKT